MIQAQRMLMLVLALEAGTRITSDGYKKDRIKVDFSANFDKHIYKIMLHNMKTLEEAAK